VSVLLTGCYQCLFDSIPNFRLKHSFNVTKQNHSLSAVFKLHDLCAACFSLARHHVSVFEVTSSRIVYGVYVVSITNRFPI